MGNKEVPEQKRQKIKFLEQASVEEEGKTREDKTANVENVKNECGDVSIVTEEQCIWLL